MTKGSIQEEDITLIDMFTQYRSIDSIRYKRSS